LQFAVVTLAAERLRVANEALMATVARGAIDPVVVAEVHEATLELIWATGTKDLAGALAAVADPR
jgi:hypothetical protein